MNDDPRFAGGSTAGAVALRCMITAPLPWWFNQTSGSDHWVMALLRWVYAAYVEYSAHELLVSHTRTAATLTTRRNGYFEDCNALYSASR